MKVNIRETPEGPQTRILTIVLDGYNAPVSAGQVGTQVDLMQPTRLSARGQGGRKGCLRHTRPAPSAAV